MIDAYLAFIDALRRELLGDGIETLSPEAAMRTTVRAEIVVGDSVIFRLSLPLVQTLDDEDGEEATIRSLCYVRKDDDV